VPDVAALDIQVGWHEGMIRSLRIKSARPQTSQLLAGLDASGVLALLGRLYAVCGQAQRVCAEFALAAAGGAPVDAGQRQRHGRAVASEAIIEHLWRLLLDWPKALGIPPQNADFKRCYGRIGAQAACWPAELRATLELDWLGLPVEELAAFADLATYARWQRDSHAPFAVLFACLGAEDAAARVHPGTTLATESECALAACAEHPWLAALGADGRWLEAHVAARLVGLATLLAALAAGAATPVEMDAESPQPGRGVALVATARGMLEHDVTLTSGRVERYAITTPTDCNFAPNGPFAARLRGLAAQDPASAQRAAALWALAFDPCVAYAVTAGEPGHA
jgi:uptake hydrogenase large subunit